MNKIQVCFSPQLFPLFNDQKSIVVVVDVLRATSVICVCFANGAKSIIPVETLEEALEWKAKGYLAAGERNGVQQKGFDFGNSPFSYVGNNIKGKEIVLSTTNGTQAIHAAKKAHKVVIGAFLNISALAHWLDNQGKDVIILCAGWKNKFNLEDSLFAGALANILISAGNFKTDCDSTLAAVLLYENAAKDIYGFLEQSSHRKRLAHLKLEKDIRYCLNTDKTDVIPIFQLDRLVAYGGE